jgi:hypothetical protein
VIRQLQEYSKIKLVNNKRIYLFFVLFSDLENITEVSKRRQKNYIDNSSLKKLNIIKLIKKKPIISNIPIPLGKSENILTNRKAVLERDLQLQPTRQF